jgi:hypothetical protein
MTTLEQRAPSLALTAARSGRAVRLDSLGRVAVVLGLASETSGMVDGVIAAIRERYEEEDVLIVNLVNLEKLPKLLRQVATHTMTARYEASAATLRAGLNPQEHVVILPDWDGKATDEMGFCEVEKSIAVAVLGADGYVLSRYEGATPETAVVELLDSAVPR